MFRDSTTLGEVVEAARFDEGEIIQTQERKKAVVVSVMVSLTHKSIYYRLDWKEADKEELMVERSMIGMMSAGEMERPYNWD